MRVHVFNFLVICCATVVSCSPSRKTVNVGRNKSYHFSPKIFQIDELTVTPKQPTEFDTLLKCKDDTLDILVNSVYVYSPFGRIKAEFKPQLGLLKKFFLTIDTLKTDIGDTYLQVLKYNSSKIIFSFNATYEGNESDLYKGEINDTDVKFINGINVGMSLDKFYSHFFDKFPNTLINKYKYFILESIDGLKHTYLFENNKLRSVKFTRDVYWKLTKDTLAQ